MSEILITMNEKGVFGEYKPYKTVDFETKEDYEFFNKIIEEWQHYKDLEEQGRLVEQKHGRWKIIGMRPVGTHLTHYCSICGGHGDNEMDYCPNCGAKMLKGTEEWAKD